MFTTESKIDLTIESSVCSMQILKPQNVQNHKIPN